MNAIEVNSFESRLAMISLRQALAQDKETIQRQLRSERLNPLGNHWRNFLIAENTSGDFIGCGQIKRHRDGSKELASIVVVPIWRGQGVASTMIMQLMEQAGPPMWLTCRSGLSAYYERFGFETILDPGMMPIYFRLARIFGKILGLLWQGDEHMAIMRWSGEETAPARGS